MIFSHGFVYVRKASGLAAKDDETQVNTLIYSMGDKADEILRSFPLSEENNLTNTSSRGGM